MSRQRDKGTKFETWIVRFMKPLWTAAERWGSRAQDRGDIRNVPSFTVEAKCWEKWSHRDVGRWFDQAEASRQKEKKPLKIVWAKVHGRNNRRSVVMIEANDWYHLCNKYDIQ